MTAGAGGAIGHNGDIAMDDKELERRVQEIEKQLARIEANQALLHALMQEVRQLVRSTMTRSPTSG